MENKEKLKQIIQSSDITEEDKSFWLLLINSAPEIFISGIVDFISEYPNELSWLTQIYKRKQEAFEIMKNEKEKGQELLSTIYKEEREKLNQLADKK